MTDNVVVQVTGLIMAGGALIAYIISEGWVDAKREETPTIIPGEPLMLGETEAK